MPLNAPAGFAVPCQASKNLTENEISLGMLPLEEVWIWRLFNLLFGREAAVRTHRTERLDS